MNEESRPIRLTLDEFETDQEGNEIAVLVTDGGLQVTVPRTLLPANARVNAVLTIEFTMEPDETSERRSRIAELQRRLFGEV